MCSCADNYEWNSLASKCESKCGSFMHACKDSRCVPLWKVNDGMQDCSDDEDDPQNPGHPNPANLCKAEVTFLFDFPSHGKKPIPVILNPKDFL